MIVITKIERSFYNVWSPLSVLVRLLYGSVRIYGNTSCILIYVYHVLTYWFTITRLCYSRFKGKHICAKRKIIGWPPSSLNFFTTTLSIEWLFFVSSGFLLYFSLFSRNLTLLMRICLNYLKNILKYKGIERGLKN